MVPVFYATDRKNITSNKELTGSELATLHMGTATTILPVDNRWLDHNNLRPDLSKLGWELNNSLSTVEPFIEARGYVTEPTTERVLINIHDQDDFWTKLKAETDMSAQKSVYIYIHGFASSGESAIYSAGIFSAEVEAPVVAFTWPSLGLDGMTPLQINLRKRAKALYEKDRTMIDQPQVLSDLSIFIHELKAHLSPETKIFLVAHSLGNRLMTRYLAGDSTDTFDGVYFLAADVDQNLAREVLKKLKDKSKYTAVYMNPSDKVLRFSAARDLLDLRLTKKLGKASYSSPDVEFVNYGEIAEPSFLKHYIPFKHLGSIIRTGHPYNLPDNPQRYLVRRTVIEREKKQ